VAELFLPLGQEDIDDTMRDFIKSEVTRELNLKICDLYQDEELSIIDKVRALLHHIARALRNFTPAPCGSPMPPPLCLTLFILCHVLCYRVLVRIVQDTFDRALAAYLRTDKLRRAMADTRDSLLKFVKDNAPKPR
jgi:hypothetical protein